MVEETYIIYLKEIFWVKDENIHKQKIENISFKALSLFFIINIAIIIIAFIWNFIRHQFSAQLIRVETALHSMTS